MTVENASALGAGGRRILFANERTSRRVQAKVLSTCGQSRRVDDALLVALQMLEAISVVENVIALEGTPKSSDAEFTQIAETIAAFANGGRLKKSNREYQELASPAKAGRREANQTAHARAQEIYQALPDSERTKLNAEFKVAQAAGKTSWSAFVANALPDLIVVPAAGRGHLPPTTLYIL
ncbi:capsular polysaccharide biosynthesis protein [Bradyrhizobium sp. USDA 4448]